MFAPCLPKCLFNIRDMFTGFECMFTPCLETHLHKAWNMFTQYFEGCLHHVERKAYTILEEYSMFKD